VVEKMFKNHWLRAGSQNYRLRAKFGPRSLFRRHANLFCQ